MNARNEFDSSDQPARPDDAADSGQGSGPLFQRFQWHRPGVENAAIPGGAFVQLLADVQEVAAGVELVLDIELHDEIAGDCSDRPIFSQDQRARLRSLSAAALRGLRDKAERLQDWAWKHHTPEGRAASVEPERI